VSELEKFAVPLPSLVVLLEIVGSVLVLYATPLSVIALPPSTSELPPLEAELLVMLLAAVVTSTVGKPAAVVASAVGAEVR